MYLAIKGNDTVYLAIACGDNKRLTEREALMEENIPICIGKKGTKSLLCFSNSSMIPQILKYEPEISSEPMTYDRIKDVIVPLIKEKSSLYGQLVKTGKTKFCTVVCHDKDIYEISISGKIECVDKAWYDFPEPFFALEKITAGQEPITRLRNIFRGLERETDGKFFPICIYNAKTGERTIYKS